MLTRMIGAIIMFFSFPLGKMVWKELQAGVSMNHPSHVYQSLKKRAS